MSKHKKNHTKNLSQQAIDLMLYYEQLKQQSNNLKKKQSIYKCVWTIPEEDIEESPMKRHFSKTQHVNVNIYNPQVLDDELQQDVKELKNTLFHRINHLKAMINNNHNKENQTYAMNK